MKYFKILLFVVPLFMFNCEDDEEPVEVNETSIIPDTYQGRPNVELGCIQISERTTTIEVWDHGLVDGDIISIIANGNVIIDNQVLDGPSASIVVDYNFEFNGYNYITLFAHNTGDIAPNTCTIAVNGVEYILEANLDTNGSIDVIVGGNGVSCN